MKPMLTTGRVSLMLLSLVVLAPSAVMGADETFRLSAPRYWLDTWAIPSGISLVGDADGDGRAELVAVDPAGTIAVARTSPLGKWVEDPERETRFGNNLVAAVVGRFIGRRGRSGGRTRTRRRAAHGFGREARHQHLLPQRSRRHGLSIRRPLLDHARIQHRCQPRRAP